MPGKAQTGIRKNVFTEKAVKHWNRPPREMEEPPSLEAFKRHVDVVLRNTPQWWACAGSTAGPEDLKGLLQPKRLYDSRRHS